MAEFFVRRPIVAIVISILMTVLGTVSLVQLPIAQFPGERVPCRVVTYLATITR